MILRQALSEGLILRETSFNKVQIVSLQYALMSNPHCFLYFWKHCACCMYRWCKSCRLFWVWDRPFGSQDLPLCTSTCVPRYLYCSPPPYAWSARQCRVQSSSVLSLYRQMCKKHSLEGLDSLTLYYIILFFTAALLCFQGFHCKEISYEVAHISLLSGIFADKALPESLRHG